MAFLAHRWPGFGLESSDSNATCSSYHSCHSCLSSSSDCSWCSSDSSCGDSGSCSTDFGDSCNEAYYTIIFLCILGALLCLCCGTCYVRRVRGHQGERRRGLGGLLAPLLPRGTRDYLFGRPHEEEEEESDSEEWMCIICGFDNLSVTPYCGMCGTAQDFSERYKRQRREHQAKRKLAFGAVTSDLPAPSSSSFSSFAPPSTTPTNTVTPVPGVAESNGEEKIQEVSLSLRHFQPLTNEERSEAMNYRRINQLTLRQKGARRRKLWQRRINPSTGLFLPLHLLLASHLTHSIVGLLVWRRIPIRQTKIGESPFGYTPRPSMASNASARYLSGSYAIDSASETSSVMTSSINAGLNCSTPVRSRANSLSQQEVSAGGGLASASNPLAALLSAASPHRYRLLPTQPSPPPRRRTKTRFRDSFDEEMPDAMKRSSAFCCTYDSRSGELFWHPVDAPPVLAASEPSDTSSPPLPPVAPLQPVEGSGEAAAGGRAGQVVHVAISEPLRRALRVQALLDNLYQSNEPNQPGDIENGGEEESAAPSITDLVSVAAYSFKEKQRWLRQMLHTLVMPIATSGFLRINVSRQSLLFDSCRAFMSLSRADLAKVCKYHFLGERGIDAGGLEREWFTLVCHELFSPKHALFVAVGGGRDSALTYHINPFVHFLYAHGQEANAAAAQEADASHPINATNYLLYYQFAGRLLGKALVAGIALPASLSLPLRKHILGMPLSMPDLEFIDDDLYRNLLYLRSSGNNAEALELDFSLSFPCPGCGAGTVHTIDLLPNGRDIAVTEANKEHYLQLRFSHAVFSSIRDPLRALLCGLEEVVPLSLLSVLDYMELDLLLSGLSHVDLEDWKRHTQYHGEYNQNHRVVQWFWRCVAGLEEEERLRLLQFVTGSSRLPAQGFQALQSVDGRTRFFNIQPISKLVSSPLDWLTSLTL
eukprot:scaffold5636_cov159-Ochromonas_danica.AAC.10